MSSERFYGELPLLGNFAEVGDPKNYQSVPRDWHVIITDIKGSTKAIEAGRYKDVNTVGAASIAALLNGANYFDLPFVFGGDGASFAIPDSFLKQAKFILAGTRRLAKTAFDMDLRVGLVPVVDLLAKGHELKISKYKISKHYHQAMFSGEGLAYAEKLIKSEESGHLYLLPDDHPSPEPDCRGLSCRWRDVKSARGETISLLVKARHPDRDMCHPVYREVIEKVEEIYGGARMYHPITKDELKISCQSSLLVKEVKVRAGLKSRFERYVMGFELWLKCSFLYLAQKLGITLKDANLERYKHLLIASTDYKKFDDTLRMIISGTPEGRERLEKYLKSEEAKGELAYGLHVSDRALMTCLVFEREGRPSYAQASEGRQVHFVDAAGGGYALAAKVLKAKL